MSGRRGIRGPSRAVLGWTALALLGLVIAGGAAYAASRLTSQPVGLTGEPVGAGSELVPQATRTPQPKHPKHRATPTSTRTPTPVVTATAAAPVTTPDADDYGGGSGHGSDDGPGHHDDD